MTKPRRVAHFGPIPCIVLIKRSKLEQAERSLQNIAIDHYTFQKFNGLSAQFEPTSRFKGLASRNSFTQMRRCQIGVSTMSTVMIDLRPTPWRAPSVREGPGLF